MSVKQPTEVNMVKYGTNFTVVPDFPIKNRCCYKFSLDKGLAK